MGKFIDMSGWVMKEHGIPDSKITVLKRADDYISPSGYRVTRWECRCECGNIFISSSQNLRNGITKSCGCFQKEVASQMMFKDLTGKRFGKLTVLYRANDCLTEDGIRKTMWHCICDCGNEKDILGASLMYGATKSCGCIQKEVASQLNVSLREYNQDGEIVKRICQCCKQMLPIDQYYKSSYTADGYSGVCKYCQSHSLQGRYNTYKKGAKSRNLEFNLTRNEFDFITSQTCHYCGEYSGTYFNKQYSGIDRIDSSIGYNLDNIVPCCEMCNRMKLDYATSDWLLKMHKILKHLNYQEKNDG